MDGDDAGAGPLRVVRTARLQKGEREKGADKLWRCMRIYVKCRIRCDERLGWTGKENPLI